MTSQQFCLPGCVNTRDRPFSFRTAA
jgi:hypothetical protein